MVKKKSRTILGISELVKKSKNKALFNRIFSISTFESEMTLTQNLKDNLKSKFNLHDLEHQEIIRIDNILTNESTLFNPLRGKRPMQKKPVELDLIHDIFKNPKTGTPLDEIGRIETKQVITSANISKYQKYHSLIIFKEPNPHKINYYDFSEALDVAMRWFGEINTIDKNASYPLLIWNYLWKSGASIIHPHMQMMASYKEYPLHRALNLAKQKYNKKYKSDYIKDIYEIHKSLGLGFSDKNTKVISYLTPIKEKEILVVGEFSENFKKTLYKVIKAYKKLGVESFNLGLIMPNLNSKEKTIIARLVDRGSLSTPTTDFGGMEIYSGSKVVFSDPFTIIKKIKKEVKK